MKADVEMLVGFAQHDRKAVVFVPGFQVHPPLIVLTGLDHAEILDVVSDCRFHFENPDARVPGSHYAVK